MLQTAGNASLNPLTSFPEHHVHFFLFFYCFSYIMSAELDPSWHRSHLNETTLGCFEAQVLSAVFFSGQIGELVEAQLQGRVLVVVRVDELHVLLER